MEYVVQFMADGLVFVLVAIAAVSLLVFVPTENKFAAYSRMLLAGLTSYLVAKLMALVYQPSAQRPFELLGVDPGASYLNNPGFPSDHALFVWVLVFAVCYGVRRRGLGLAMVVLALVVCAGRVLALVHTPLDIIGGIVAASIGALWYVDVLPKLAKK